MEDEITDLQSVKEGKIRVQIFDRGLIFGICVAVAGGIILFAIEQLFKHGSW